MKAILIILFAAAACSCARSDEVGADPENTQLVEPAEAPFGIDDGFSSNGDDECSGAACRNRVGN